MQLSGQRILVTGGGGFIGHYVVDLLRQHGARVRVFELPGKARSTPDVELFEGDLTRADDVRRAVEGVDGVFHMAVLPFNPSTENPRRCLEINVDGSFNVFEAAQQFGVKKVVFSSASSVYGDTLEVMDEQHPLMARTVYGASKIAGEALLRALASAGNLEYATLRYMNVYGPFMGFGLVDSVLKRIASGQPPVINGDGSQSFDFVYVSDVAGATVRAMEADVSDEVFNVGSGDEKTVRDVVSTLLELTGSPLQPEFRDVQVPMLRRVGSSEKAARLLGWRATIPFHEGMRRVVEQQFRSGTSAAPST